VGGGMDYGVASYSLIFDEMENVISNIVPSFL
jgi:hypothetical protein